MLPTADELRARLGVGPEVSDTQLGDTLTQAGLLLEGHIPDAEQTNPLHTEAVAQLAVKLWETRAAGRVGIDPDGGAEVFYSPGATAGLVKSVWAFVQATHPTGGLTV